MVTDLDIHIRRQNPTHIGITCRSFDGIYDVRLSGRCSCGGEDCSHLAAVLAWLIPARPAVETTEASALPERAVPDPTPRSSRA
jgi:hypothetical protein